MGNLSDKNCTNYHNTHFMLNNVPPPPENRAFYEIRWKNICRAGRSIDDKWRMCITCWIPKGTNTHSEYVILVFQGNSGCTNAPQCYVNCTLPDLFLKRSLSLPFAVLPISQTTNQSFCYYLSRQLSVELLVTKLRTSVMSFAPQLEWYCITRKI